MHALTVPAHKVPVFGHFTLFFAHFLRILEAAQIEMHGLFGRRLDPAEREHTAVERGVGRDAWHVVVLVPVGAGDDPRQAHGVEAGNGGDAFASGLIYAMMHDYKPMDMVNFAVASSAIKHTIHGDANITDDVESIRNLMNMNYDIKR